MALLKIARMGHPVLRRRAEPVADPAAPSVRTLVRDMMETMVDAQGAGLAAPQVHVPLRVVIFTVPPSRAEPGEPPAPGGAQVLINPQVTPLDDGMEEGWEGCLSIPGMIGLVPRFTRIHYLGVTPDGQSIEREARGFHARVVQHECDHLDGVLYPMRMTDLSKLGFVEEMRAGLAEAEPQGDA